jgi:N-acetylglucosamine-6-phosphate deacetylase
LLYLMILFVFFEQNRFYALISLESFNLINKPNFAVIRVVEVSRCTMFVKNKDEDKSAENLWETVMGKKKALFLCQSIGAIDLHFHGAYGIDVMTASLKDLQELSSLLWQKGVAGFCPTTLSSSKKELAHAVTRLGNWIRSGQFPGAKPLGIHLEGPFIHPNCSGAHPKKIIRKLDIDELDNLWGASFETLKILTVAPETLISSELKRLVHWSKKRRIHLSIGHSQASEKEASQAFKLGFRGVTHAWNALPFHHRTPGVMGAALGQKTVFLELMIDRVHVAPSVIRWTLHTHPAQSICFISDCLSGGGDSTHHPKSGTLGNLKVHFQAGACRLPDGQLAGGGFILTEAYSRWLEKESEDTRTPIRKLLTSTLPQINLAPLRALQIPNKTLLDRQVRWILSTSDKISVFPVDSASSSK